MKKPGCLIGLSFILLFALAFAGSSGAEDARFFRIAGPVPTTITDFNKDGFITWTNVTTNATFTVQSALALLIQSNHLVSTNWVDYLQVPATNSITTQRLTDLKPPTGMVLIPAGSFLMGDRLDDDSAAQPVHTVFVSAFYMDKYLVTKALWDQVKAWHSGNGYNYDNACSGKAASHPVQMVNWYDMAASSGMFRGFFIGRFSGSCHGGSIF